MKKLLVISTLLFLLGCKKHLDNPLTGNSILVNDNFNYISWYNFSNTVYTDGSKLIVPSGAADRSNYLQNNYFNFGREVFSFTIIVHQKGEGIAISFADNATFYSTSLFTQWNLSSGNITMAYSDNVVKTNVNFGCLVGDTLSCVFTRDGWYLSASVENKRTGIIRECAFSSSSGLGTGGRLRLYFLGGAYDVTNFKIETVDVGPLMGRNTQTEDGSLTANEDWAIVGDSHGAGAGATGEQTSFVYLLFGPNRQNFSFPAVTIDYWLRSGMDNLLSTNKPNVLIEIGGNDARNLDTATFRFWYTKLVDTLLFYHKNLYLATLVPTLGSEGHSLVIKDIAAHYGLPCADIRAAFIGHPEYISEDGIHMNNIGHKEYASVVKPILR
jgi:hypothetical protein